METKDWEMMIRGDGREPPKKIKDTKYQPRNKHDLSAEGYKEARALIIECADEGMDLQAVKFILAERGLQVNDRYVKDRLREYKKAKSGELPDVKYEKQRRIAEVIMRHVQKGSKNKLIHRELEWLGLDKVYPREHIQYRASEARLIHKFGHSYRKHNRWFFRDKEEE
jgi:hypothetical protein